MNQKLPSVFITIGLSIFLLITCSCEGETQKAEPLSSTDASYQTKEPEKIDNKFYTKQNNLGAILAPNTQVEKVAEGFKFTEGPLWHPDGFLLFSDIPANTIYKWQPESKTEIFRRPSGHANGNALDRSGRLITAEHGNRRISLTEKDGQLITLARQLITLASNYTRKRLNSLHYLAVRSNRSI